MWRLISLFIVSFVLVNPCLGDTPGAGDPAGTAQTAAQQQVAILTQGKLAVDRDRAALKDKETKLESMKTGRGFAAKASPEEIDAMQKEVDAARQSLAKHEEELMVAIVGVTGLDDKSVAEDDTGDVSKDFREVLRPLLRSAKDLVANQRRSSEIQEQITSKQQLLAKYDQALQNLQKVTETAASGGAGKDLREMLAAEKRKLETGRAHLPVEIGNLQRELASLESERQPWAQYATTLLRDSVMRRLWNLLLATLAVAVVLLLARWCHRFFARRAYFRRMGVSVFLLRLANVFYYLLTAMAAGLAGFLVLYAANDWFLLTLVMLALAGLLLAGRHTLPKLYEQVKLLLNLGSAREGERVIYHGLPWMVKRLNFYCDLINPSLTGGAIRLTMRDVIPLNSRPFDRKERWFPTEEGDWVILSDGMLGKVVMQTPEYVQVLPNGGSYKTYPTLDFLKQNPRNLSHNFRIQSVFGISYKHAVAAQDEIPRKLEARVRREALLLVQSDEILNLAVTICHASPSSVDLMVLADFKGSAAPRYADLERNIQRACLAEAMDNHWEIPFPQLTIHQDHSFAPPHSPPA